MTRAFAALAAALPLSFAAAQGTSHPHHGAPSTSGPTAPAAQAAPAEKAATDAGAVTGIHYRSPFRDYRPFSEEVVAKDWRKANDEVRDAGGHVGLMKDARAGQPPSGDRK